MTLSERFNDLITRINDIYTLLTNIEAYIGTKTETSLDTLSGRIAALENSGLGSVLFIDDRLLIDVDTFTTTKKIVNNSCIYVRIYDIINDEVCEVAEVEQEDFTIDYTNSSVTLNMTDYDGMYAKAVYTTSEV